MSLQHQNIKISLTFFSLAKTTLTSLLLIVFVLPRLVASPVDTIKVNQLYQKGRQHLEQQQITAARAVAQQAITLLEQADPAPLTSAVKIRLLLGDCALEVSNFSQALQAYKKANQILKRSQADHPILLASILNKLGNYCNETKDFERAKEYLESALEIRKKELGSRHIKVADVYNNLGNCANAMGDFTQAIELHQEALAIRTQQLDSPHPYIAQSYNNIGMSLADKGNLDEALAAYQNAYTLYSEYYQNDHLDIADVCINIGDIYSQKDQLSFFSIYQKKALRIYQKYLGENHLSLAIPYNNLANIHRRQEDFKSAIEYDQKALDIRIKYFGHQHADVAESYNNMAWNACFEDQWDEAKKLFSQCFSALNYFPDSASNFEDVNESQILLTALEGMAFVHSKLYEKENSTTSLQSALSNIEQASELIDFLRIHYDAIDSKLKLAERANPVYDLGIQIALRLFQISQAQSYLHEAWKYSEKSKGILLLEALNKTQAEQFAGVPETQIQALKSLEFTISNLEKQRYLIKANQDNIDQTALDSINHQLLFAKRQLSDEVAELEKNFPEYYNLRYQTDIVPVDWIQDHFLQSDQTLIEYFIGESQLYLFVMNKEHFSVKALDLPANFYIWIYAFQEAIRNYSKVSAEELNQIIQQYIRSAYVLQQMLIKPVKEQLTSQLIIIPDGELGLIPFGALLSSEPESSNDFNLHPYLIHTYAISYNYSATLLKEMAQKKDSKRLKPYLGFAPTFSKSTGIGLKPLKYNHAEVQKTQAQMGGEIFIGEQATREQFLAQQQNYDIIHLATHATANNQRGDFSWLAFSPTDNSSPENDLLYVKDIYNTPNLASMVILSACETGTGELQRGEGITSIARSFSYAGAKSLMATLWSVDDQATNQLVQALFTGLQNGQSKDQALQTAKLSYLQANGRNKAHPYYWASMINIGSTAPLSSGFPNWIYWLIGFITLGLLIFWWSKK